MEDKVICNKSDLVNVADAVRSKLGVTDTYYVSELSSAIQNIQTGGITPSGTISITENGTVDVSQYANAEVNVSASPSLQSKSVTYTENGTATIAPDEGYDGLSSVDVTVDVSSGGASPNLQTKTATPSTSSQSVTPDDGYDGLSEVTIDAMPSGSLNSPTVSSSGLVTASVGTSGYLASGTNKTLQLTTQASKTVTPSTSNQTAVASGRYTTGAVTVKGDSNLVASNIKSGVSIFGVSGELPVPNTINVTFVNNTSFGLFLRFTDTDFSRGGGGVSSGKTHTFTMPADSEGYGMFVAYIFESNDSSVWNYNLNKSNGDVCDAYDGQTQVGTRTKYYRLWFEEKQVHDGVTYTLS